MPKLKYNDGTGFKQIVPTKEEFDEHLAEIATEPTANKILKLDNNAQFPRSVDITKKTATFDTTNSTTQHTIPIDLSNSDSMAGGIQYTRQESLICVSVYQIQDPVQHVTMLIRQSRATVTYLHEVLSKLQKGAGFSSTNIEFNEQGQATFTATTTISRTLRVLVYRTIL